MRSAADSVMPTVMRATDLRARDILNPADSPRVQRRPWEDGALWPTSRPLGNGQGLIGEDASTGSGRWGLWPEEAGDPGRKKIWGTALDSSGSPLAGVSLQAVRADGSSCDGTATSDASGYYLIPVSNPTGAYKVDAYLAGSPDVAGTTVNNLTPSP